MTRNALRGSNEGKLKLICIEFTSLITIHLIADFFNHDLYLGLPDCKYFIGINVCMQFIFLQYHYIIVFSKGLPVGLGAE